MTTVFARAATILAGAALGFSATVSAVAHDGHGSETEFAPERVGAEFMVMATTANDAAREPFLRGLALLHNFEYTFAATEFRKAQEADPDFVMAYWGEAMTHNHPLWEEQDRDEALAILSRLGADPAARAAKARNEIERQWLSTVETLYGTEGEPASKEARDLAYLAELRAMLEAYPEDVDVRAFTGLAVLGSSHGGRQIRLYMEAAAVLEPGFMTHEMHPGILHYLIHSYDDPVHAPLGERMAERYAVVAPDAGHAQHMVSHIYHALADWEASEKANILADGVVDQQRIAQGRAPADCGHYNEWLIYSLLQQGKDASQRVAACRAATIPEEGADASIGALRSFNVVSAWQAVDTGIWDPLPADIDKFAGPRILSTHVSALMNADDADHVTQSLNSMREDAAALEEILARRSPDDRTTMLWVNRAIEQVNAIRILASGETAEGLAALKAAAEAESALPVVFGPPAIAKPSWELLGEELLALGRNDEAAEAFTKSLEFAPGRRLSLMGLQQAQSGG